MSKYDSEVNYLYKYVDEDFDVDFSFTNDLGTSETLSSCTVTCTDDKGTSTTSSMISDVTVSSPKVYFTIDGGTANRSYEIKMVGVTSDGADIIHYLKLEVFGSTTLNAKLADPEANSYVTLREANEYIRTCRGHNSTWDTLTLDGKKRLLIDACRDINRFNFVNPPYYDNQSLPFPDDDHDTISGNPSTPLSNARIKDSDLSSDTYGDEKYNDDYWKYGSVHITDATPLDDIRLIASSNAGNDLIHMDTAFTATPTTNTDYIAFAPLDNNIKRAQMEQALYLLDNEGNEAIYNYKNAGVERIWIGDVRVHFKRGASLNKIPISPVSYKLLSRWIRKSKRVARA